MINKLINRRILFYLEEKNDIRNESKFQFY